MPTHKIAHLTSVHSRSDTRIYLKQCISLASYGYSTSLIVADGKGDEQKNGVTIFDVGSSKGRLDRIRNAPGRVLLKAVELDADLYHLHDPELIPIGLKLKNLGKKVIFDIHENTDLQILTKEWIPFYLRKIISWIYSKYESYACRKFDALLVPQISMQQKFSQYAKTELIANFPSEKIENLQRDKLSKFKLLYSGGLGEARGLYNMLDLIKVLSKIDSRYKLTLAGPINGLELERARKHPGWTSTVYLGNLTKNEIYAQYKKHTFGLILFNNVGQYYMSYALKLFEYMQCGMTVLMPDFGDWLTFNKEFKVGLNVNTNEPHKIASLIDSLSNEDVEGFSINNIELAATEFVWSSQEKKLINIYKVLLSEI